MNVAPTRRTETEKNQVGDYFGEFERYYDQVHEHTVVMVYSGDRYVTSEKEETLVAVTASCIVLCLHDKENGVGGMHHFLLPGEGEKADEAALDWGERAIENFIADIERLGGRKSKLVANLFGGADIVKDVRLIGSKNIDFVKKFLKNKKIKTESEDLGGNVMRRVHYSPDTGKVWFRRLYREDDTRILVEEEKYIKYLGDVISQGSVGRALGKNDGRG